MFVRFVLCFLKIQLFLFVMSLRVWIWTGLALAGATLLWLWMAKRRKRRNGVTSNDGWRCDDVAQFFKGGCRTQGGDTDVKMETLKWDALNISVEKPLDWSADSVPPFNLLLIAPASPSDNYRHNVGFSIEKQLFAPLIRSTVADHRRNMADFEEVDTVKDAVIGGRPAFVMFFRWQSPVRQSKFSQILVFIQVSEGVCLQVNAATQETSEHMIATLCSIIRSIRFRTPNSDLIRK